jgi:hypothetical protein
MANFAKLYGAREHGAKIKTTKVMDDAVLRGAQSASALQSLADSIRAWNQQQAHELEELLFQQRTRLVGGQRVLATRPTKKSGERRLHRRQQGRVGEGQARGSAAHRARGARCPHLPRHLCAGDGDGRRLPRSQADALQCRPAGKPTNVDVKFPGTYNARACLYRILGDRERAYYEHRLAA